MPFNYLDANLPVIERQKFSNWCWASSTLFVCDYYKTNNNLTQPKLVASVLGIPSCSSGFPSPSCNKTHDLGDAFHHFGHLEDAIETPLSAAEIKSRFNNGEGPIGCQMLLPLIGGGHAVVMIGVQTNSAGKLFVLIADPADGSILTIAYEVFRNNFRNEGGYWIRSYITKP